MNKFFLLFPFLPTFLLGSSIKIKPKLDIQLRYSSNDKQHTALGKSLTSTSHYKYSDSVFGGDFGLEIFYKIINLTAQLSFVQDLEKQNNSLKIEKTYFDNNQDEFTYLSNFFLSSKNDSMSVKIGRQQYNNNLVNRNKKVISNQYQGINFNYQRENIKINTFYFTKVASSTLSNIVPLNHYYGAMGYGKGYKIGKFVNLSKHIINKDKETNGAVVFDTLYDNQKFFLNIQNLFIDNFFNTLYLESKFTEKLNDFEMRVRVGGIVQKDIGENYNEKEINGKMYQTAMKIKYKNLFSSYIYSKRQEIIMLY